MATTPTVVNRMNHSMVNPPASILMASIVTVPIVTASILIVPILIVPMLMRAMNRVVATAVTVVDTAITRRCSGDCSGGT